MAAKTYTVASGQDGNYGALVDGVDQTAASRADGWTVGKVAATNQADFDAGTKQATTAFAISAKPASFLTGATANAFKTPAPLTGVFANAAWTFTFAIRATVVSAQTGRIRMRVFRSVNADGSGATEITAATQVGGTTAVLSTTADATSAVTWSPGATVTLANEYLFFVIAWEIVVASGSNTGDAVLRTGQAAGGSRLVTPNFAATWTGTASLGMTFSRTASGVRKTFSSATAAFTFGAVTTPKTAANLFGSASAAFTFSRTTAGVRKTFASSTSPYTFSRTTAGVRKTFGSATAAFTFSRTTAGQRKAFGTVSAPFTFNRTTAGIRKVRGTSTMSLAFAVTTSGRRGTRGAATMVLVDTFTVNGTVIRVGVILNEANNVYLGTQQVTRVYAGANRVWG